MGVTLFGWVDSSVNYLSSWVDEFCVRDRGPLKRPAPKRHPGAVQHQGRRMGDVPPYAETTTGNQGEEMTWALVFGSPRLRYGSVER